MPAVETMRLDVAQSDLKAAGLDEGDIEVVGGGAFGVVDESNWDVCEQDPAPGQAISGTVRLIVDRSCEASGEAEVEAEEPPAEEEATPTEEPPAETFKMPDLVGENLQTAQDKLQSLGSYVLRQDDATGMERFQVLDSNWKVCSQKPAPRKKVSVDKLVVLTAVKLNEDCP